MVKTDALNIAQKYANALKPNYELIRIILFGSYAKGNYNDDCDIEIAIVVKDYYNLMDIQLELMRLRRNIDSEMNHTLSEKENL